MSDKSRSLKRVFAKLALVLFGIVIGAGVAEIGLRIIGFSYPEFYQVDASRGYALRPGVEGWYRKEGVAYIRVNSDGLRDREHAVAKPAGTVRIAVLGDSYPEALSVSDTEAFWSVMEGKLRECNAFGGRQIEVINFGVSGYGTAQELLTLRERVWKYSPDIVMLTITTNNDITDNSRVLKKTDEIPYFVYRDDHLVLDDAFKTAPSFMRRQSGVSRFGRWLRDHSRLVQAMVQGHHAFKVRLASWRAKEPPKPAPDTTAPAAGQTAEQTAGQTDQFSRSEELGTDNLIYLEPNNETWNEAWRVTEGLIRELRDEVRGHGSTFTVVTLSNGPQVLPEVKSREGFMKRFGLTDLFYPDNRIKSFCLREAIPVVTLAPDLQKAAEEQHAFLHGFGANIGNGHWNAAGHRVAGELIAKKLCADVLLK